MLPQYTYAEAKYLLNEGDVLLYRGRSFISRRIQKITKGPYSHVSIASERFRKHDWESVQFREFKGGITVNLDNDIDQSNCIIDVYRPLPFFSRRIFHPETKTTTIERIKFNGRAVTDCMRNMTGLPYGYRRILYLFRYHLYFWRDWSDLSSKDDDEVIYPVCSTIVAHCFSSQNFDLLFNKSDNFIPPSALSHSPRLNAMFSMIPS